MEIFYIHNLPFSRSSFNLPSPFIFSLKIFLTRHTPNLFTCLQNGQQATDHAQLDPRHSNSPQCAARGRGKTHYICKH